MKSNQPVFTKEAVCQDCYRCLRECPVKAITVQNGAAAVELDRCIFCGTCIDVCPAQAKAVRDDLGIVKDLLAKKPKVVASVAPSHAVAFPFGKNAVAAALLRLGFSAVSETALGANIVSRSVADWMRSSHEAGSMPPLIISTACTAIVMLIRKHYPRLVPYLSTICSPVVAHSRYLKKKYGPETGIVFFGPCPAKKAELGEEGCELDAVLSFSDLLQWTAASNIDMQKIVPLEQEQSETLPGSDGALYPIEGGMIESIRKYGPLPDVEMLTISGLDSVNAILDDVKPEELTRPVFLELLSCKSGCINGVCMPQSGKLLAKRAQVQVYAQSLDNFKTQTTTVETTVHYAPMPFDNEDFSGDQLHSALERIGKHSLQDEINCGGCGYVSCRQFAQAMLHHRAEPAMCVSYMRELALKKANALMQSMPAGVVIVDKELRIIECNLRFVQIALPELVDHFKETQTLSEMKLSKLARFHKYFSAVLTTGQSIPEKQIKLRDRIISISVFPIETARLAGGIIQDITQPAVRKERIINQAREVSRRQLTMVQQIASLLGENAADSETLLSEIIASFSAGQDSSGERDE